MVSTATQRLRTNIINVQKKWNIHILIILIQCIHPMHHIDNIIGCLEADRILMTVEYQGFD